LIASLFFLRKFAGSFALFNMGAISGVMLETYKDVTPTSITIMLKLQFLMYLPLNFPVNASVERFGIRYSMIMSCLFLVIGGWVRMF
jgi:hypothetical protein